MDYYSKYIKYKIKYLKNKKFLGGSETNLKYYNLGQKKYNFEIQTFLDIKEGTAMLFIKDYMIVITKPGIVYKISSDKNIKLIKNFKIDNANFTNDDMEQGLLGIAYNSKTNLFYISYTENTNNKEFAMNLVISKYRLLNEKLIENKIILKIPFRNPNHHGGTLEIGPDDKLYLSTGDGGPQNDPHNEAQNPNTLRGKIIRIDLKTNEPEIIAMGIRNAWKFTFDNQNRLWFGDVGWEKSEKVCLINNLNKKYNFGWSYFEGSIQNKPGKKFEQFDPPIFEYPTDAKTGRSVIGGYFLDQFNTYFFADYLGFLKAIKFNNNKWKQVAFQKLENNNEIIYSLGYDGQNLYCLTNQQIYIIKILQIEKF